MYTKVLNVNYYRQCVKKHYVFLLPALLFFILRLDYVLIDAFIPDENWFAGVMAADHYDYIVPLVNFEAYGTAFWTGGKIIHLIFGDAYFKFALRIITLLCIIVTGYCLYLMLLCTKTSQLLKFTAMLAFFSMPFMWFTGKLITPEFYGMPLLMISAYFILFREMQKAFFIVLGFAVALKITALPFAFAIFCCYFLLRTQAPIFSNKNIILAIQCTALFVIGLILCNINIIWDISVFWHHFTQNQSTVAVNIKDFRFFSLWQDIFTQAGYREGSLIRYRGAGLIILPVFSFILISILIVYNGFQRYLFLSSYFLSLLFFTILVTSRQTYAIHFVWYTYTLCLFPLVFYTYSLSFHKMRQNYWHIILLSCFVLTNLIIIVPFYLEDSKNKKLVMADIDNREKIATCIIKRTANIDYTYITFRPFIFDSQSNDLYGEEYFTEIGKVFIPPHHNAVSEQKNKQLLWLRYQYSGGNPQHYLSSVFSKSKLPNCGHVEIYLLSRL